MKRILLLSLLTFIGYYWILIFRFCHPFPKNEFFTVIGIQFGASFTPYLISRRYGRIMTIISALIFVRIGPISGIQYAFVTLMGVFWGGVAGNLIREFYERYKIKKESKLEIREVYNIFPFSPNFLLILFLITLTLERFLIYFNAPFLNGFGILETMYVKNVSSKEAYALSMEIITNLLFPILYCYSEEIGGEKKEKILKDWTIGIAIGIGIQFCIMLIQIFYDGKFLAENTNLAIEFNRKMGLFRDSSSSTWIIPIVCFLFYKYFIREGKIRYIPILSLILIQVVVGIFQGRGFWVIFLLGIIFLLLIVWRETNLRISNKNIFILAVMFCVFILLLYLIPKSPDSGFGKFLLIPSYIIKFLQTGDTSVLKFDPYRYYLNLGGWNLFLDNPSWGTGVGSFIVNLKDETLKIYMPGEWFDNPSFFIGFISEVGIMGLIYVVFAWLIHIPWKNNVFLIILLIPALSFGYHIVQPDGAFVILLLLIIGFGITKVKWNGYWITQITPLVILLLLLINTGRRIYTEFKLPEFRKEKMGSYQLLAYDPNKVNGDKRYHVFKGKTIWILAGANGIELDVFLDNSTSKKNLRQKWTLLDRNRNFISGMEITLKKNEADLNLLRIPNNAYYLQVEELDEIGKTKVYGDVPFCISTSHFNEKNELF